MELDETVSFINRILHNPPLLLKNAFESKIISEMPYFMQILELIKRGVASHYDLYDNRKPENLTLYAFLSKQYDYMNDLIILCSSYKREEDAVYYKLTTSSVWSLGAIVSAMLDNLLCFAWLSDDFVERSNAFANFYVVQDLANYPTNVVLEDGTSIDNNILEGCKKFGCKYKKRRAVFNSDNDFLNRNNYVNEWYNYSKNNLKELSEDINCIIKQKEHVVVWTDLYKVYQYACDFKHMSPQKIVLLRLFSEHVNQLSVLFKYGVVAFLLCNQVFIKIYKDNGLNMDDATKEIEKIIEETYLENL